MIFVKKKNYFSKIILAIMLICFMFSTMQFVGFTAEEKIVKIGLLTPITGDQAQDGQDSKRWSAFSY